MAKYIDTEPYLLLTGAKNGIKIIKNNTIYINFGDW